jgi:AbrB family looped-hinge helix DNA binding protein
MTYRVGPKGQVVLPKAIRERHGIGPGDLVEVDDDGGEIVVRKALSRAQIVEQLRGSLPRAHVGYDEQHAADRRRELEKDERRLRGQG